MPMPNSDPSPAEAASTVPTANRSAEFRRYQSHEGVVGMSDSARKLERIALPEDLSGKAVLDIGCNEGLFCHWAKRRGASRVVGIDFDQPRLEYAIKTYGGDGIDFRFQNWTTLPEGPFDVVLWTSAMHYEKNPRRVFEAIKQVLSPDGVLILECGVVDRSGKEMVRVQRHSDACLYPTIGLLLEDFLPGYAVRRFYQPEITPGDPVPREVFHCSLQRPIVSIVHGDTKDGKSFLGSRFLAKAATKVYSIDVILARIMTAQHHHTALEKTIRDSYDSKGLLSIHVAIEQQNLSDEFAKLLTELVSPSDEFVVFEGYLRPAVLSALSEKLSKFAVVWHTSRFR
jgi:SAM-dependent methyltransferase